MKVFADRSERVRRQPHPRSALRGRPAGARAPEKDEQHWLHRRPPGRRGGPVRIGDRCGIGARGDARRRVRHPLRRENESRPRRRVRRGESRRHAQRGQRRQRREGDGEAPGPHLQPRGQPSRRRRGARARIRRACSGLGLRPEQTARGGMHPAFLRNPVHPPAPVGGVRPARRGISAGLQGRPPAPDAADRRRADAAEAWSASATSPRPRCAASAIRRRTGKRTTSRLRSPAPRATSCAKSPPSWTCAPCRSSSRSPALYPVALGRDSWRAPPAGRTS